MSKLRSAPKGHCPALPRFFSLPVFSIFATILLVAGCAEKEGPQEQIGAGQTLSVDAIPVETLILKPQPFTQTFITAGEVEPDDEVTVSAEVAGRITEINFDLGDRVKKDDLLIAIDDASIRANIRQIEAQIARARTQLASARRDLERNRELLATNAVSQKVVDDWMREVETFENDVAAQQAALDMAQVTLSKTKVYSPTDGVVSERYVSYGEYVGPGTQLFEIVDTDTIHFVFSLPERDVPKIAPDESLTFTVDAWPGETFEAPVKVIAPAGNEGTRTFRVELAMANPADTPLRPGMSGRAHVVRGRYENVYLLPEDAVLREDGQSYIYITRDNNAHAVPVEAVTYSGAQAVVRADLAPGATAVILGQHAVDNGSAVRVRRTHEEPPVLQFD